MDNFIQGKACDHKHNTAKPLKTKKKTLNCEKSVNLGCMVSIPKDKYA
jgi:hypothetical protein